MKESYIERRVCDYANEAGWSSIKLNGPGSLGKPDRMFFRGPPPRLLFIEFKAPGKKPTRLQRWWGERLLGMGFKWHVVDSTEAGLEIFKRS